MAIGRRVYCRFCEQTYFADQGERCNLCGKTGGLLDNPPPERSRGNTDRTSESPSSGLDAGTILAAGCFGIMAGAALGVAIAFSLPTDTPGLNDQAEQLGECGLFVIPQMTIRFITGSFLGAIGGGLTAMASMFLIRWLAAWGRRASG